LVNRYNPDIAYTEVINHFNHEDMIDLREKQIQIAFAVINYKTNTQLHSSDFVEWEIYIERRENLHTTERVILSTHPCSLKDYDNFYPINSAQ
jgi:hypothetical protein